MELQKIKMAFFDFDDTLQINPIRHNRWESYESELIELNQQPKTSDLTLWRDSFCPSRMKEFVKTITDTCLSYVLTHEVSSQWILPKQLKICEEYGDVFEDLIIAGCIQDKITIMRALMQAADLRPDEILFVDDNTNTQLLARAEGFIVVSPIEILGHDKPEALAKTILGGC